MGPMACTVEMWLEWDPHLPMAGKQSRFQRQTERQTLLSFLKRLKERKKRKEEVENKTDLCECSTPPGVSIIFRDSLGWDLGEIFYFMTSSAACKTANHSLWGLMWARLLDLGLFFFFGASVYV